MELVQDSSKPAVAHKPHKMGWLVRYKNGTTAFVFSEPMHWPPSVISNVMVVVPMAKPDDSPCMCINCTDGEAA